MHLSCPTASILAALARFPRTDDPHEELARQRIACQSQHEADAFWTALCHRVLLSPVFLRALWPAEVAFSPDGVARWQEQLWVPHLAAATAAEQSAWVEAQGDARECGSLMQVLLDYLGSCNAAHDSTFGFLARYYSFRDLVVSQWVLPECIPVLDKVFGLLDLQARQWGNPYCGGYAYQGYARIGLAGIKPTETRLAGYGFTDWLTRDMHVLEIGANNGFMAIELARRVGCVDAIEYNPFLVEIGRQVAAAVGQDNVYFEVADFAAWMPRRRYDVVLSFANHCTIDGNLSLAFESFVAKLWHLTADEGWLLFESHNVFGPGKGGAGDDGDLDRKFDVMERYFDLVDSKMTCAFVPFRDVDKLFVVLRRRAVVLPVASRCMRLAEARTRYAFLGRPFG